MPLKPNRPARISARSAPSRWAARVLAARPSRPAPPSLAELTKMPTRNSRPVRGLFWNMTWPTPRSRVSTTPTAGLRSAIVAQLSAARRGAPRSAMVFRSPPESEPAWLTNTRAARRPEWCPGVRRAACPLGGDGALSPIGPSWAFGGGSDVEVEDGRRHIQRAAGVGDVDDAADPALDRGRAEQQIRLLTGVAEGLEVLDGVQAGPLVGQGGVHVVVGVGVVVHRDPDERHELAVARLDPARQEDRVGADPVLRHPALDQVDTEVDEPAHLDRAAEGDLAVPLAEVEVAAG